MSHRDRDSAILRAIMTTAVDAIIVSDATGNILRASPAAEYLFGFDEGELIGRDVKSSCLTKWRVVTTAS